jgi:hypothetical protein
MRRLGTAVEILYVTLLVLYTCFKLQLEIGVGRQMGEAFLHLPAKTPHKIMITD